MFDKTTLCNKAAEDLKKQYQGFMQSINSAKSGLTNLIDNGLNNLKTVNDNLLKDPANMLNDVMGEVNKSIDTFNNFADLVNRGGPLGDALSALANCIGPELAKKYFGINTKSFKDGLKINALSSVGKLKNNAIESLHSGINDIINNAGNNFDSVIGKGFDAITRVVPKNLIDDMLKLMGCLETFCNNDVPNALDVEQQMGKIGLDINNKPDFTTSALSGIGLSTVQTKYATGLSSIMRSAKNTITSGISAIKVSPKIITKAEDTFTSKITGVSLINSAKSLF